MLDDSVQITEQRKQHQSFSSFFTMKNAICFCNNVSGLFYSIGIPCISSEWRLFIDSSSKSPKAVLIHNGNKYPSLPLAHSVCLKETYKNVKTVLNVLKYDQYNWEVIGDFKMIAFLMGMQRVSRNIPATFVFGLAEIPNPTIKSKYGQNVRNLLLERKMSKNIPLINPKNVLLPPLYIKLGLIKQFAFKVLRASGFIKEIRTSSLSIRKLNDLSIREFAKALDKDGAAFKYLQNLFPKLSEAKVKSGILIGPQPKIDSKI